MAGIHGLHKIFSPLDRRAFRRASDNRCLQKSPILTLGATMSLLAGPITASEDPPQPSPQWQGYPASVQNGLCLDRIALTLQEGIQLEQTQDGLIEVASEGHTPVSTAASVNTILAQLENAATYPAFESAANPYLLEHLGLDHVFVLRFEPLPGISDLIDSLRVYDGIFVAVEPIAAGFADSEDDTGDNDSVMLPDDELFPLQWGLENRGQIIWGVAGVTDADIDASSAWQITRGSSNITIAIADSGISMSHPDLAGQIVRGRNFTSSNPDDTDDQWVSHGTFIAGIVGGLFDNEIGVAGLAPECRIMPIRVMDRFGFTFEEWVSDGIIWAVDHGAAVINVSIGFPSGSSVLRGAVQYAYSNGVVICASTGNISTDPIGFPARYPETIAVGATNNLDEVASFTSTGPQITLSAPGRNIYSTWDTNNEPDTYKRNSGTSFSTPYVTATVALIKSLNPTLVPDQVRHILTDTADDIAEPGWDQSSGAGRLNTHQALLLTLSLPHSIDPNCLVDRNGDGNVDFSDLQVFLAGFSNEVPESDMNHDGLLDFFDIQIFLSLFQQGCTEASRNP